ncbi:MAG: T9SS type A sorting domain-containing protein [Chitinophagaceae bacterium]|nr:T9SS type A sorting domain-containing protein [Chitinophagaceae bacterium]
MNHFLSFLFLVSISFIAQAQIPNPALIGYWHNWNDVSAPYVQLDAIDSRYNVIEVSFAVPTSPSDMTMLFTPDMIPQNLFISKMQSLQSQGKKVLLSIGGATTSIDLTTLADKNAFVNSMTALLNTYGFDGIDIDIEHGSSIMVSGGTIAAPGSIAQINLIDAIKQIMTNYQATHSKKLLLTMAPETAYVQGGQSAFGGIWGGYLPIIHALRDSIDVLQVQLYNSGSMYGIDANIYTQGTADFMIAMTEAVIQGFNTAGGFFTGLTASKVAVGLPACSNAAGGGFTDSATVSAAIKYLRGMGPKPASYTLFNINGYPNLRGMMTWSVNWDATNNCANVYQYANNYDNLFGGGFPLSITELRATAAVLKTSSLCEVSWFTEGHSTNQNFIVERSQDGEHFAEVGHVNAGTVSDLQTFYTFDDHLPGNINSLSLFYRIRFVDLDQRIRVSNMVRVAVADPMPSQIQVFPNPFISTLVLRRLNPESTEINIQLLDITGRLLREWNQAFATGHSSILLEGLQGYAPGHYLLRCTDKTTGQVLVEKITK